ncbi:MAG: NACHT domain-containing protein [Actinoallomurus sp.]
MSESLTYVDALKILGDRPSRLIGLLDGVMSAGLATWAATAWTMGSDPSAPMNLFDLKDEVVRFGHDSVRRISERRNGLSRYDRTQRLAAAHAVLVVSSYFETLDRAELPLGPDELTGSAGKESGGSPPKGYVDLIDGLLSDRLPLPEPHVPYARTREAIEGTYDLMSRRIATLVRAAPAYDSLAGRERARVLETVHGMPPQALTAYDDAFRRLATDNREFEVWAGFTESAGLSAGLMDVGRLLAEMAGRAGERPRSHLIRTYRAALTDPVVATGHAPEWVALPALGEAYVSPRCKAAEVGPGDAPAGQDWWDAQEPVPHVEAFLAGFLTLPRAVQAPLIVLGEPGSGKSKLTEVLAARLPDQDFLPVRVELRDVEAESLIQEQIEQAIYRQAGERVAFHDLLDAAEGALPVVMLDGFDELLQAAGVNRYDYLEQVRDFQRRQLALGRPVVVIVTSRTVVADRVRYPAGSIALQLQPFTDDQVRQWLEVWRRHNTDLLRARGLRPLTAEAALSHRDLARQPLLLLMLAIFDATENTLLSGDADLGQAELYEALLMDFALREIRKYPGNASLSAGAQRKLAETELDRLAAVALAMFARGRQSVSDAELDRDLALLRPEPGGADPGDDAALSLAQRAIGRFFFIHRSEAHSRGHRTRTYEFLHTTFGEFLVAWLTNRALGDLVAVNDLVRSRSTAAGGRLDDGFLYSILSFACVAERVPVVDFLAAIFRGLPAETRASHRALLLEILDGALYPHPSRSYAAYEPARHPLTRRLAAYSANLTVLLVLLSDEGVRAGSMFRSAGAAVERWIEHGHLWKGQLTVSEWHGLVNTVRVGVGRGEAGVEVTLTRDDGAPARLLDVLVISSPGTHPDASDYDVLLSHTPESYDLSVPASTYLGISIREMGFLPNWHTAMLLLQSVPYLRAMGGEQVRWWKGEHGAVLPVYLLSLLDYAKDAPAWERARCYAPGLEALESFPALQEQILLRLRDDARTLPVATTVDLLREAARVPPSEAYFDVVNDLWTRNSGKTTPGIGGRGMIIALARALRQKWPDADLDRLAPGLRTATYGKRRPPES